MIQAQVIVINKTMAGFNYYNPVVSATADALIKSNHSPWPPVREGMLLVRINCNFEIKQCLARLQLLAKAITGEEIARELIACLSVI